MFGFAGGGLRPRFGFFTGAAAVAPAATVPTFAKLGIEGDSLSADLTPYSYPNLWAAANPAVPYENFAVGGAILGDPNNLGLNGGNSLWARASTVLAAGLSHLFLKIGANDFASSGTPTDAATYLAAVQEYVDYMRAQQPGLKIMVGGNMLGTNSFRNATAQALWPLYRAAAQSGDIDAYIPIGEHPFMTAARHADATWSDGLHPSEAGHNKYLEAFAAGIDPIVALSQATTPTQFTFSDLTNVAVASSMSASVVMTGMKMGQAATASVSGGTIARGQGTAGATSFATLNGDFVTAGHTSSASLDTDTNTVVTVGTRSDTFTSRTVSSAPAIAINEGDLFQSAYGGFSVTRTSDIDFPAGRPMLWIRPTGGGVMDSVSFEGQAGALAVNDTSGERRQLWIAPFVQGAPTTLTIEIARAGAAIGEITALPMAAVDLGTGGTFASTAKLDYVFRADGPHAASGSVTVASGGRGLVIYENDQGGVGVGFDLPAGWTLEKVWGSGIYSLSFTATQIPTINAKVFGTYTSMLAVGLAQ